MNKKTFKIKKVRYLILFILFTVLTLTLLYNSCGFQSIHGIKFTKVLSSFLQDFRVEINKGSYSITTLKNIPLRFKVPNQNLKGEVIDYEMKISLTPDCSDGEWEPYQEETVWTFQSDEEEEKLLFIYVKFREKREKETNYAFKTKDFEEVQGESKCVYDSIVYDTIPPRNLRLSYKPAKKTNQGNAEFRFTAKDQSPIHFQCQLQKSADSNHPPLPSPEEVLWTPCDSGINYEPSNFGLGGDYTFFLRARDLSGNTSGILKYTWTIDLKAPSLNFASCPEHVNTSKDAPTSISVESANLDFPVSLYCKNNQEQFEPCGIINSNPLQNDSAKISSDHFITETLSNNYFKNTLIVKGLDSLGNFSYPIECSWYEDTAPPEIQWIESIPQHSYGTSTDPYIYPNPFKIRIDDNSFQTEIPYIKTKIKYKIYKNEKLLRTCDTPDALENDWCALSLNQPTILLDPENNSTYVETQPIHITQGLEPGISTANEHKIEIQVKDAFGNTSNTIEAIWDVYGQVEKSSSTHSISTTTKGKADILFVLDDSNSISKIAQHLGASFSGIIGSLRDLNWQIAVTSMERPTNHHESINFGQLVRLIQPPKTPGQSASFLTNRYILSSQGTCPTHFYCSSEENDLEAIFQQTIINENAQGRGAQNTEVNNFNFMGSEEYGIESVNVLLDYYRDITPRNLITLNQYTPPSASETQPIKAFLREDSTFVVIFITDEKNCSGFQETGICHNHDINDPNHPQNLINKVKTVFGEDKKFISYPIIPEPNEGYKNAYPEETLDDYLKLAKATQGRESKNHPINPVIWVDVDPTTERTSRSNNSECSTSSSSGVYTRDLCTISEDILKVTNRTIQLNCTPVTENLDTIGIHPPRYFYSSDPNADSNNPTLFTRLNTDTDGRASIRSVAIKISESWNSSSSAQTTNRVTLEAQPGNDFPIGTYKVEYFCYSDQISTSN